MFTSKRKAPFMTLIVLALGLGHGGIAFAQIHPDTTGLRTTIALRHLSNGLVEYTVRPGFMASDAVLVIDQPTSRIVAALISSGFASSSQGATFIAQARSHGASVIVAQDPLYLLEHRGRLTAAEAYRLTTGIWGADLNGQALNGVGPVQEEAILAASAPSLVEAAQSIMATDEEGDPEEEEGDASCCERVCRACDGICVCAVATCNWDCITGNEAQVQGLTGP